MNNDHNNDAAAAAAMDDLVAQGLAKIVGIGDDGHVQYRLTEAGLRRAESLIGIRSQD